MIRMFIISIIWVAITVMIALVRAESTETTIFVCATLVIANIWVAGASAISILQEKK